MRQHDFGTYADTPSIAINGDSDVIFLTLQDSGSNPVNFIYRPDGSLLVASPGSYSTPDQQFGPIGNQKCLNNPGSCRLQLYFGNLESTYFPPDHYTGINIWETKTYDDGDTTNLITFNTQDATHASAGSIVITDYSGNVVLSSAYGDEPSSYDYGENYEPQ